MSLNLRQQIIYITQKQQIRVVHSSQSFVLLFPLFLRYN